MTFVAAASPRRVPAPRRRMPARDGRGGLSDGRDGGGHRIGAQGVQASPAAWAADARDLAAPLRGRPGRRPGGDALRPRAPRPRAQGRGGCRAETHLAPQSGRSASLPPPARRLLISAASRRPRHSWPAPPPARARTGASCPRRAPSTTGSAGTGRRRGSTRPPWRSPRTSRRSCRISASPTP